MSGLIPFDTPFDEVVACREGVVLTAQMMRSARACIGERFTGMRVAVFIKDVVKAIPLLHGLNGYAQALGLFSVSYTTSEVTVLAQMMQADVVVSDMPEFLGLESTSFPVLLIQDIECTVGKGGECPNYNTSWILSTSGTSGGVKLVAHDLAGLRLSARTAQQHPRAIWGMLYDYTRFAGCQVMLQALMSRATLLLPDNDAPLDQRLEFLIQNGCTHLSATPSLWRKVLMVPGHNELPLRQVTLGGEIADDKILEGLAFAYPMARITHIYASTEAGVGFSVKDGKSGFPAAYLDHPPLPIGLKIENGRLLLKRYAETMRYVGANKVYADSEGWVDSGDIVECCGDRIYFLGRASGVINVGGNKVFPEHVEQILQQHEAVEAAHVYAKPNPLMGELVVADIVLKRDYLNTKKVIVELKAFARQKLPAHGVPAFIYCVDGLDITASGKLRRS